MQKKDGCLKTAFARKTMTTKRVMTNHNDVSRDIDVHAVVVVAFEIILLNASSPNVGVATSVNKVL